jgi:hypothetical protein
MSNACLKNTAANQNSQKAKTLLIMDIQNDYFEGGANPLSGAVSGHLPVFIACLPVRRSNKPFRLFSAGFGLKNNIRVSFRRTFAACNFRIKYDKEIV